MSNSTLNFEIFIRRILVAIHLHSIDMIHLGTYHSVVGIDGHHQLIGQQTFSTSIVDHNTYDGKNEQGHEYSQKTDATLFCSI